MLQKAGTRAAGLPACLLRTKAPFAKNGEKQNEEILQNTRGAALLHKASSPLMALGGVGPQGTGNCCYEGNCNRRKYISYLQKSRKGRRTEHTPMQHTARIACVFLHFSISFLNTFFSPGSFITASILIAAAAKAPHIRKTLVYLFFIAGCHFPCPIVALLLSEELNGF